MNYSNKMMAEIRAENKMLKTTVDSLKDTTERLWYENKTVKAEFLDLKYRSMKKNIVIMGIKEEENDNCQSVDEKGMIFMKHNL